MTTRNHICCGCGGLCDSGHPCPMADSCHCRRRQPTAPQSSPLASRIAALHERGRLACEDAERQKQRQEEQQRRRVELGTALYRAVAPLEGVPLRLDYDAADPHEGTCAMWRTHRAACSVSAGNCGDHNNVTVALGNSRFKIAGFHIRTDASTGDTFIVLASGEARLSVEDALSLAVAAAETHFDDGAAVVADDDIPF